MRIDCDRCSVRGAACSGCVVSVLLGPPEELEWDEDERAALDTLARSGLVPPLRLAPVPQVLDGDANHIHLTA